MKRLLQFSLLITGLAWCIPAHATITVAQNNTNASCGGAANCTVSGFSAIAAGSVVIGVAYSSGADTCSAGTSNAGTWTVPTGGNQNDTTAGNVCVQYVLTSTGSPTTVQITTNTANVTGALAIVLTFTGSSMAFDVVGVRDASTAAANLAGVALTPTGTNDFILQYGHGSSTAPSAAPNSGTNLSFNNSPSYWAGYLNNSTNGAAGSWTNVSQRAALGNIAFKEAAAATAHTMPPAVY